ncbi:MAG: hypothetical protein RL589_42 [Actinomycetota bacterium]|jgi:hypothetical protein
MGPDKMKKFLFLCEEMPFEDYIVFSKKFSRAFSPEKKLILYFGINNFNPYFKSSKVSIDNMEIITISLNGQPELVQENFRREAINEFFKAHLEMGDPFSRENKSILWMTAILYFEPFAIFRRNVAIACTLAQTTFDSIFQLDRNLSLSDLERPWCVDESNQAAKSFESQVASKLSAWRNFILRVEFLRGHIRPFSAKRYLRFMRKILFSCLNHIVVNIKRIMNKSRFALLRLKSLAKTLTKKSMKFILLIVSKWSIKQAANAKFVIICDASSIKQDPLKVENKFFVDYFPDIETYYSEIGATKKIALRPRLNIRTVYKLLRNGFLPVWPTIEKISVSDQSRVRSETRRFAAQTFQKFRFLLPETVMWDVELYYPEHDFTVRYFQPFVKSNSQIILLMWEGRNRAIATGLNQLGLKYHAFQSALGSYDLSHAGLENLGVRSPENQNGVPIPASYFLWRYKDKELMINLGYRKTELETVGSLRISTIRNSTKLAEFEFYDHLFGKMYARCFVWAPVLTALETPTLFELNHIELFDIFFKKLNADDCVVIKPWPGADLKEFKPLTIKYPGVVLWNPKPGWTNAFLLQNSFGLISTFSSFIFEAIANGARVVMIDFPETKMYFNFETYQEMAEFLPKISSLDDLRRFSIESWDQVILENESSAIFDPQSFFERLGR